MAHKSGRQFIGMGVRGFRISSQDDVKDRNSLNGREILNFGKEFYELGFLRANTSIARVQATL